MFGKMSRQQCKEADWKWFSKKTTLEDDVNNRSPQDDQIAAPLDFFLANWMAAKCLKKLHIMHVP